MKFRFNALCNGLLTVLIASITGVGIVSAQTYPTQPVKIIVPTTAGGISDNVSRLIGGKLSEMWGQPVVVENRSGAGTQIGSEAVARSKPDGYTLMVAYTELVTLPSLNSNLRFNVIDDFSRVAKLGVVPALIISNPSFKAKTLPELLQSLKEEPGKYTYSSGGPGSIMQLFGELFKQKAGVDVLHIPYRGSAEATLGVIGGDVNMMVQLASANIVSHIKAGKLHAIAATTPERIGRLNDVPTTTEAGLPDFKVEAWYGVFAPAGVPKELIDKINQDVAKVVAMQDVKERMATLGIQIDTNTPEEFDAFVRVEHDLWAKVIKDAGIKAN